MDHRTTADRGTTGTFDRNATGLPAATPTQIAALADGATFRLDAAPIQQRIGGEAVRMLAYNGSVPGPTLRVRQGSSLSIDFANHADLANTVHWHGLRLDNRSDGTHQTQAPVPLGGRFRYDLRFPDPGIYWYHPHVREDYGQELGLYGAIVVEPTDPAYWPPAHRELVLTLDDLLVEDGRIAAFDRNETTFSAMGRFGNVFLTGGAEQPVFSARRDEVVRFYLINVANARVFNVAVPGARLKLVGGDSGRVERETFVESVILAPSERAVVDVHFPEPGRLTLEHRTPARTYPLAAIEVDAEVATPPLAEAFGAVRRNPEWAAERERLAAYADAAPDKTLAFVAEMDMGDGDGASVYACPMHPEVVSDAPGRCPICGMALLPVPAPHGFACPMHPDVRSDAPGRCPICGMALLPATLVAQPGGHDAHADHGGHGAHAGHGEPNGHAAPTGHGDVHAGHGQHAAHGAHHGTEHGGETGGIEWEDDMVAVNRLTTPANTRWKLVDKATGASGHGIDWEFRVGDRVKLRLVNELDSDHPMHHPFHVHGAGRFVVLARDGVREDNLVWKDTVLVRRGQTVDILLDVTNPGVWMAHCHIAEHHESGMMLSFRVTD